MEARFAEIFEKKFRKIKDLAFFERIEKGVAKIISNPAIGKPMRYERKGTRETYIGSHRLAYRVEGNVITFLDFHHKDEQ